MPPVILVGGALLIVLGLVLAFFSASINRMNEKARAMIRPDSKFKDITPEARAIIGWIMTACGVVLVLIGVVQWIN